MIKMDIKFEHMNRKKKWSKLRKQSKWNWKKKKSYSRVWVLEGGTVKTAQTFKDVIKWLQSNIYFLLFSS